MNIDYDLIQSSSDVVHVFNGITNAVCLRIKRGKVGKYMYIFFIIHVELDLLFVFYSCWHTITNICIEIKYHYSLTLTLFIHSHRL